MAALKLSREFQAGMEYPNTNMKKREEFKRRWKLKDCLNADLERLEHAAVACDGPLDSVDERLPK